ncbi:glycosyltransferase [Enterobacter sp. CPE_E1214]|uniref:glycosyltransferase n=1 Tax=unclassified Enterobacter TaxID=2608935 RepID=UPI00388ECC78
MTMHIDLHSPYLIAAPDYRESSLGIQVLHRLCHMINERGGRAWMVGCTVNPDWNAPALTQEAYEQVISSGKSWIAVYPEVTTGNPFSAPVTVRYMLNREGVIMQNAIEASADDLFFWYRPEFADKEPNPNILGIECYDLSLFQDDQPVKDKDFLYLNRIPESALDLSGLPENITILSMRNPLSLRDLAMLLKRGRVLYTYESSGTCLLAMLCGCPVVSLSAPGYEHYALNEQSLQDIGGAGFGYSDSPEALDEIRAGLPIVRDVVLAKRRLLDTQFEHFLSLTQAKAQQHDDVKERTSFSHWLSHRTLPTTVTAETRLLHVILCPNAQVSAIDASVASLTRQGVDPHTILLVAPEPGYRAKTMDIRAVTGDSWVSAVRQLAETEAFDWLHCIDAGVEYTAASIGMMRNMLSQAGECQAIYTDEAVRADGGEITPIRKPDFNLDLFLASPHRYLRRIWFRRESWLSAGQFNPEFSQAFEFDVLIDYLLQWGTGCIGHIADITTLVPASVFDSPASLEEAQILQRYLQHRGFSQAQAGQQKNLTWRISYPQPEHEKVSILLDAGDDPALLIRCVESLINNTEWQNKEILLAVAENASSAMIDLIKQMQEVMPLTVIVCGVEQNFASRMNLLEQNVTGDFILLLDLHTLFVLKNWLTTLLSHVIRPEVGSAGPKFITTDQRLLSAGMIAGADGWVGHVGQGEPWQTEGELSRYQCEQNYTVLSSNCLLVKREAWQRVGGLSVEYDDQHVIDIILPLKLKRAGYLAVWTPFSVVVSDNTRLLEKICVSESTQRQTLLAEMPEFFTDDPAYNRYLSLQRPLFRHGPFITNGSEDFSSTRANVLLLKNGEDCEYSKRIADLLQNLSTDNAICLKRDYSDLTVPEILRLVPNIVVLTHAPDKALSARLAAVSQIIPLRIYALADSGGPGNNTQDQVSVVTHWLTWSAEREAQLSKRKRPVSCLPVLLGREWVAQARSTLTERRRVLCIPEALSVKEREFISRIIAATHTRVDWIILGAWPAAWLPMVAETVRWRGERMSPEQLHQLQADIAIIFRLNSDQNRFKDDYQAVQLAACGIGILASDVPSLQNDLPFRRLNADPQVWQNEIANANSHVVSQREINAFIYHRESIPEVVRRLFM